MRRAFPIALLALAGCMSRPGVIDCTTGRAYPGFSKPLCGGPFDPFVWLAGDCETCCAGCLKCAYTPYGGRTGHGEEMYYTPGCTAPPLQWAAPAVPGVPSGHTVICPPPAAPSGPLPPNATDDPLNVPPRPPAPLTDDETSRLEPLFDARHDVPGHSLR